MATFIECFGPPRQIQSASSGGLTSDDTPRSDPVYFKVHSAKLAGVSTFFEDMTTASVASQNSSEDCLGGVPKVTMSESLAVVQALVDAAYNKSVKFKSPRDSLGDQSGLFQRIFKIYEAANKYGFNLLKDLSSLRLE